MSRGSLIAVALGGGLLLAGCQTLTPRPEPAAAAAAAPPAMQSPSAAAPPAEPTPAQAASVKARCVPRTLQRAPKYPDTDAALRDAGGAADRYQLMAAGRLLRMRRLAELEKVVEGCR